MATNFLWGAVGTVIHLLTTELNALAVNADTVYGPEVGGANNPQMGQLSLHIASSSLAFTANSYVQVFFVSPIATAAGGTYPTHTSGATPALAANNYLAATIWVNPKTQSANVVDETQQGVIMPLGFFKCILLNKTGVILPATGNTLDFYPTPSQY